MSESGKTGPATVIISGIGLGMLSTAIPVIAVVVGIIASVSYTHLHYQRLLDYLKPDTVHVLLGGRIVKTGGPELAKEIEARGFDWIKKEASEL